MKSYRAITVKDIINELTKDDYPAKGELNSKDKEVAETESPIDSTDLQKVPISVLKPKGKRSKRKGKKRK